MQNITINLSHRTKLIEQQLDSQLRRCEKLLADAQLLVNDRRSSENVDRGRFSNLLIDEAKTKLIECQLMAASLLNGNEDAAVRLALTERWVKGATDILNDAYMVIDDQKDIFGKDRPSGGLWDK